MWFSWMRMSEAPPSTSTPSCRGSEQPPKVHGPVRVKRWIVASSTLLKSTRAYVPFSVAGHLTIACSGLTDSIDRPSWLCPVTSTCSRYVPGQTLTLSFGPDASTAAWIDVNVACLQSLLPSTSSTQNVCGGLLVGAAVEADAAASE